MRFPGPPFRLRPRLAPGRARTLAAPRGGPSPAWVAAHWLWWGAVWDCPRKWTSGDHPAPLRGSNVHRRLAALRASPVRSPRTSNIWKLLASPRFLREEGFANNQLTPEPAAKQAGAGPPRAVAKRRAREGARRVRRREGAPRNPISRGRVCFRPSKKNSQLEVFTDDDGLAAEGGDAGVFEDVDEALADVGSCVRIGDLC